MFSIVLVLLAALSLFSKVSCVWQATTFIKISACFQGEIMPQTTSGFDPGDDEAVVSIFRKWDGGPLGDKLFTVLAGIIPQPIVEVVVLRENNGTLETVISPRPEGDIMWPGKMHSPGSAMRRSDFLRDSNDPLIGVFERIQRGELGIPFASRPTFVGMHYALSTRGPVVSQIFVTLLPAEVELPTTCTWYPIDELGEHPSFIQEQLPFMQQVAAYFREHMQ